MSQLILGVHSGSHDAVAAIFQDYELRAAVQLERLTRRKSDGREHPDLAIDEVLSITGATRNEVDVVCFSRSEFPTEFYRNIRGVRWIREKYRKYVEGNNRRYNAAGISPLPNVETRRYFRREEVSARRRLSR